MSDATKKKSETTDPVDAGDKESSGEKSSAVAEGNFLKPKRTSLTTKKIRGRGLGSGKGRKSGRGTKGYKSRSGSKSLLGFEGGQNPLIRRMPKIGFSNQPHKNKVGEITIDKLSVCSDAEKEINLKDLKQMGLVKGRFDSVKILIGKKKMEAKINVKFGKDIYFSKEAAKILNVEYRPRKDNSPKYSKKKMTKSKKNTPEPKKISESKNTPESKETSESKKES